MKIFHSIQDYISTRDTIFTLGTFDGVHIGHKKIIERLSQSALEENCESLILTFFPHPRMVLNGGSDISLLNTLEEKIDLLKLAGLENLIIHPFDSAFSNMSAKEFVTTVLVEKFNIRKIIIGHDHRFGKDRSANFTDLESFGRQFNFNVEQISAQEIDDVSVSSTKIRNALSSGDINLANQYLGYDYFLTGIVSEGKRLGRTIGFPTANLEIPEAYKLIPKQGVYVVRSIIGNETVFGMMNIGTNPTVDGHGLSIEIHYFDFNKNLYGSSLRVHIIAWLRDETRFESLKILQTQLEIDRSHSIKIIQNLS